MIGRRSTLAALAAAGLALPLASCGDPPGTPSGPAGSPVAREPRLTPPADPPAGTRFTATVRADGDHVYVEYRVANDGSQPVVVFDGVPATDSPNPAPADPQAFYVRDRGDGSARLAWQVFGMSEGVAVAAPSAIRGTVVPPGEDLTVRVRTGRSFPLRRPYQDVLGPAEGTEIGPVRSVEVCVGVAAADKVVARAEADSPHPVYGHDTATANQQYVFCSGPHRIGE